MWMTLGTHQLFQILLGPAFRSGLWGNAMIGPVRGPSIQLHLILESEVSEGAMAGAVSASVCSAAGGAGT